MTRAMKGTLIGILAIVILMLAFSEITGRITNSRIHKRVAYWKSLVDKELPPGSAKESVQQWGKDHHLNLIWVSSKNLFDANVEQIPVVGIGFPCDEWNIIIEIYIGNDGKSVRREVYSVGSCI